MVAASVAVLRRLVASFTVVLALGALCWLLGNAAWLVAGSVGVAIPWWLAFLVLTIAGERLELTRFLATPALAERLFFAIVGIILVGALPSASGRSIPGSGFLLPACWRWRSGCCASISPGAMRSRAAGWCASSPSACCRVIFGWRLPA